MTKTPQTAPDLSADASADTPEDQTPALTQAERDAIEAARRAALPEVARRALEEADARKAKAQADALPTELGGRNGPEPVRYGDWENKGLAIDF